MPHFLAILPVEKQLNPKEKQLIPFHGLSLCIALKISTDSCTIEFIFPQYNTCATE